MDATEQIFNEYSDLRAELRSADSLNYQIIGIMVAGVAALLTARFNASHHLHGLFITFCVYVVTFPSCQLLCGNRRRIWRISTYLRVFLEPELERKWETRLHEQSLIARRRHNDRSRLSSNVMRNEWLIVIILNWLAVAVIAVRSLRLDGPSFWPDGGVVILMRFIDVDLSCYTWRQEISLERDGKVQRELAISWRRIRRL